MEPEKYTQLKDYLTSVLKTAKKLGLNVQPGGGYSMGYDINNLPPYPVGLFGALSIVEGAGARCKLGLTFDQTQALEDGFNGCFPNQSKKKKKRSLPPDMELMKIGTELTLLFQGQIRRPTSRYNSWDSGPDALDMPVAAMGMPVKKANAWPGPEAPHKKKKAIPASLQDKVALAAKKQKLEKLMVEKLAQEAPANKEKIVEEIMAFAKAIDDNPGILKEIKADDVLADDIKQHEAVEWKDEDEPGVWKMAVEWNDDAAQGNQWEVVAVNPNGEQAVMDAGFEADDEEG